VGSARESAAAGYLERAVHRLELAERTCPSLRDEHAALLSDWLIEGRMLYAARRWVTQAHAGAEAAEASRAERGAAADPRTPDAWMADGHAAELRGDLRVARVFYTRALDAFDRGALQVSLERVRVPAEGQMTRAFSSRSGWFFDETRLDAGRSRLTAWSLRSTHPYTLEVDGWPQDAGISPRGVVLYKDGVELKRWLPALGSLRGLGVAVGSFETAAPGGPSDASRDGRIAVWHSNVFAQNRGIAVANVELQAVSISPDGARLTTATSAEVAWFDVDFHDYGQNHLAPRLRLPIPGAASRDVALANEGSLVVTRDDAGVHLHRVMDHGIELERSFPGLGTFGEPPSQPWGRPGALIVSRSNRWLLLRGHGAYGRMYSLSDLGSGACWGPADFEFERAGFMEFEGREWLVSAPVGSRWRLVATPERDADCGRPTEALEFTRLQYEGQSVLEAVRVAPCAESITCPPSGVRATVSLRWTSSNRAERWATSQLQCGMELSPTACALRFYDPSPW
jgi:hypothetical protein